MATLKAESYLLAHEPATQGKADLQQEAHRQHQISPNQEALFHYLSTFPGTVAFVFLLSVLHLRSHCPKPGY